MVQKLYFVEENQEIVGVYEDHDLAREEAEYMKEDHPLDHFRLFSLTMFELENYPEAYDYASDAGILN